MVLLVPVFVACHQGSTWARTMYGFVRCFAHDFQHKTCHKCVHQNKLGKIFPMVYHTPVTSSRIRRHDRNEWVILGYACFEVSAAHSDKFSTGSVSEIMVRNFLNVKGDFFHHIQNKKKPPLVYTSMLLCGRYVVIFAVYIKTKQNFHIFYCFSHFSAEPFYNIWKVILQNPSRFLLRTSHITKNSFSLFTGFMDWDMWLDLYNSFSQN